jgi:transcriptional regulator with XRE-family HTH domain
MMQCLQIAKTNTSPLLCSPDNDFSAPVLQNAKMEHPEFPNENFVAAWRERAGMTQAQLAEKIGTNGSQVSLLESGDRQLSPKWLRRIAAALSVPLGYLLEYHPDQVPADLMEAWSKVPAEKREDAIEMLRVLGGRR